MKTPTSSDKSPETAWKFPETGTHTVVITPALAEFWITQNLDNRKVKEDVVKSLARDMMCGNWRETHQGIAFSRINGRDVLIDGQHRLLAVMLSKFTIRMQVTFGLEAGARDAIDRNCPRSVADQMKLLHGIKDGRVIAMIANQIANLCCEDKVRRASVPQVMTVYGLWKDAIDNVLVLRSVSNGLRQAGILAGFAFAWSVKRDAEKLFEAFNAAPAASGLDKRSPVAKLRNFCTSIEAGFITLGYSRGVTELTLQALWLQERKQLVEKLEMGNGEGWRHFAALQQENVDACKKLFPAWDSKKNEIEQEAAVKNQPVEKPVSVPQLDFNTAYEAMKQRLGLKSAAPEESLSAA